MNKTPKTWLFNPIINGNSSWAELFQSISAFTPLIEAICVKHGLETGEIKNLTPGTNAVFRINDRVIKIFAPIESGYSTDQDYFIELSSLKHANDMRITAPFLVCTGSIEDRYLFRYIIMDFINGQDAESKLMLYQTDQKIHFSKKLKEITKKLNTKTKQTEIPELELNACLENRRWKEFSNGFCQDRKTFIKSKIFSDFVYTHGDLTGENMIINDEDDIYIIDFADSRIAPYYYEWPPIVFALFGCDPAMMEAYFGDFHNDEFFDKLTLSLVIHEFGSDILQQICDLINIPIHSITDICYLKALLIRSIESGHMKVR